MTMTHSPVDLIFLIAIVVLVTWEFIVNDVPATWTVYNYQIFRAIILWTCIIWLAFISYEFGLYTFNKMGSLGK